LHINDWLKIYRVIAKQLSIEEARDGAATVQLSCILDGRKTLSSTDLSGRIRGCAVAVYGAGPSLGSDLDRIIELDLYDRFVNIAADGAVTAFLERGRLPAMVFTDLDGRIDDLLRAGESGSWMVVHAHGDNIPALKEQVPRMKGQLIGSTQVYPLPPKVLDLGGFTDGDRPVYWSAELGASQIILMGMDFGNTVGSYSKASLEGEGLQRKLKKLEIGRQLIGKIAARREILNLTGSGSAIDNVRKIQPGDIDRILKVKSYQK
jgi:uncharacterized Rossmann fold enzyme